LTVTVDELRRSTIVVEDLTADAQRVARGLAVGADAEDLAQEYALAAVAAAPKADRNPAAYADRAGRRGAMRELRRLARSDRRERPQRAIGYYLAAPHQDDFEARDMIDYGLSRLPPHKRSVLVAWWGLGGKRPLYLDELAKVLGRSMGAASRLVDHAEDDLWRALTKEI
jgi:DNA-directed RNA polymerase specialized sigma24 family protein